MRPMLGISVDDGELCAVLVDADVPNLGPFDSQRGFGTLTDSPADAAAVAAAAMLERAATASLTVHAVAVVLGPDDEMHSEEIAAAVRAAVGPEIPVEQVSLDAARLEFLAGAPELAALPVLALHTRTSGVESASVVETASRAVLSTVSPDGDEFDPHGQSLPEAMDEAIARAGSGPDAVVFLDLEPGDAAPARELATILGVPFVTPHGVPWHRATGGALVAAAHRRPVPSPAPVGRRRSAVLMAAVTALVVLLGGGLAMAVGGVAGSGRSAPGMQSVVAPPQSPVPQPTRPAVEDPCADGDRSGVQPASWPARASDPDPRPAPPVETTPPPCTDIRPTAP